jgi:hypothetical protein
VILTLTLVAATAHAANVKMPLAPAIEVEGATPLPITVGLYLPDQLRSTVEVVKTSPFDKLKFAVGEFTAELLERNLPLAFAKVVPVANEIPADPAGVDVVVSVEIVRFEVNVPHPASNPYTSTAVYRLKVTDPTGGTLFVQTATGAGQTSKGLMSGFKAQGLAAEAAKLAMVDAATQALEGVLAAEELRELGQSEPGAAQ